MGDPSDIDGAARRAWTLMTRELLPDAACRRGWPISTPEGFERALRDQVGGAPGTLELILAVEIGAQALDGRASIAALARRSRATRAAPAQE